MVTKIVKHTSGATTPQTDEMVGAKAAGSAANRPRPSVRGSAKRTAESVATAAGSAARQVRRNLSNAVGGTLGLSGERMSKVDTAWLRMDSPANLMMIVGVWVLKPGVTYAAVCERLEARLLKYPRFVQRVVEDAAGATWVEDHKFDIRNQVVLEALTLPKKAKKGAEQAALQDRVAQLATLPLNRKRPLWQFHLVEDYQGGSALIVRIHHCIADGIALISVTQSLVDGGAPPPPRKRKVKPAQALGEGLNDGLAGVQRWLQNSLLTPMTQFAVKALGAAGEGAAKSMTMVSMLSDPQKSLDSGLDGAAGAARMAFRIAQDSAALLLMPDDSPTRLKGVPGQVKKVAWCAPVPLADVKAVCKALNCSVNDVLMSCVAGAIADYLQSKGDPVAGKEIRAMVPVNLRPLEQAYKLGNQFGLAPVVLPIGMANPIERVYEVRRRMGELKGSMQPLMAFGMLAVAGLLVKPAQDALLNLFSKKTTAVMTNVPGPQEKLMFCGSLLEETLFWVPQSGTVGMGVSILSYGGGVQFGVVTDAKLCPDPQAIVDQFAPQFARLAAITRKLQAA